MDKDGRILTLGIESSCDETSASVVANGREVLSNVISSQIEIHKSFGGVVPEIASRKHVEAVISVIDASLKEAGVSLTDIDNILKCVLYAPPEHPLYTLYHLRRQLSFCHYATQRKRQICPTLPLFA